MPPRIASETPEPSAASSVQSGGGAAMQTGADSTDQRDDLSSLSDAGDATGSGEDEDEEDDLMDEDEFESSELESELEAGDSAAFVPVDEGDEDDERDELEDELEDDAGDEYSATSKASTKKAPAAAAKKGKGRGKQAKTTPGAAGGAGMKIKFKLGEGGSGTKAVVEAKARKTSARKNKGKKRVDEDQLSDFSDDEFGSDGEGSESSSSMSTGGPQRMTARQKAKELGGDWNDLQSLPMDITSVKAKAKLTEEEIGLRRAEASRKRKQQVDKRLEDEKTETIHRLLNKTIGPRAKSKLSASAVPGETAEGSMAATPGTATPQMFANAAPPPPKRVRYVSSIKDGEYKAFVSFPVGKDGWIGQKAQEAKEIKYPGPRPPPKTRMLKA